MTNDADDNRPEPASDTAGQQDVPSGDGGNDSPSYRRLWDRSTDKGSTAADAPNTPTGTPTPGQQNPVGRPEDTPNVVAHPVQGTAPKPTNEPPSAPTGSGSAPTTPRPVDQGQPTGGASGSDRPGMAPPPGSEKQPAEAAPASERPENPFAPKPEPKPERTRRFARTRKPQKDQETGEQKTGVQETGQREADAEETGEHGKRTAAFLRRDKTRAPREARERKPLGRGNVIALTIAGIAGIAILALIATSALWWLNRDTDVAGPTTANLTATPGPVLSGDHMMNETMAKSIDPSRSWSQTLDQAGINDASPNIACVGPLAADQPIPQITQLRSHSASGDDRTAALQRADAYANADEAKKVFEFRSAELGSCTDTPLYIENGLDVTGIGDEALGVRLVLQDETPEYHSVLLVRTGRVIDLLDVARMKEPADMTAMLKGLGPSINRQCGPAIGLCTGPTTSVSTGVPPVGGEQRGFLASGDIPRVTAGSGTWRGSPPITQIDIQDGSSCEAVDFSSIGGTGVDRQQRTYLLRNDAGAPPQFGIDEVVLTMGSKDEANGLVNRVTENMKSCSTRTLTSKMDREAPLLTPGQDGVEVRGNWFIVTSQIDQAQTQKYRVGIFSAGEKVVYLRSNPSATFDFSDPAWIAVNLRAGERVTQVD